MQAEAPVVLNSPAYAKRWSALFLLCTAQFLVIMDTSIIGVALPAIKQALGYGQADLAWIFNAYVIGFGGLLLLGGRLSDLFGARRVFTIGFFILTLASLLAGLAWSEASMNAGRALQGFGSALIAPSALTLVMSMFTDPKEVGKALGFWGAAAAAGGSAGVFLGGVITEWLSWRWTFLVNIPVGIAVMLLTSSLLLPGRKQSGNVDVAGAITITLALVCAVYALVTGQQAGWTSLQTAGLLGTAGALLFGFLVLQKNRQQPLMPLHIFRVPNLAKANLVMALLAGAWIPLWFFLNLYLQQVLKLSAFASGLALLPMTVAIMFLMVGVTGKLIARFGTQANLATGLFILAGALELLAQAPTNGSFLLHVLPASLLGALGMSLAYIPGTMSALAGAKTEETGLASGIVNTSYQIGSALGLAAMVAVSSSTTSGLMTTGSASVAALNTGFQAAFHGAAIVAGFGMVLTLLFRRSGPAQG